MADREFETDLARQTKWIEVSNAVCSALLVLILLGCALLLDRQARRLEALEAQLIERNAQGKVAIGLLDAAVDRLDRVAAR